MSTCLVEKCWLALRVGLITNTRSARGILQLTEFISSENKARCIAALNRITPAKFYFKFRLPVCPYSKIYDEKCLSHECPQTLEFPIKIQCTQSSVCEVLQHGISFIRTFIMKSIPSTGLIIPTLSNILSVLKSLNRRQKKMKGGKMFIYF